MNKIIIFFISIIFITGCSFNKSSKFWTETKKIQEENNQKIENGDWLIQKSITSIIFEQKIDNIWIIATNSLGIEIGDISNTSGYS